MSTVRTAAFRVDASLDMGTGHVMRCLTLADELARREVKSIFLSSPHAGNLIDFVREKGYEVRILPLGAVDASSPIDLAHAAWLGKHWEMDAEQTLQAMRAEKVDWLVVDHYALDSRWEDAVKTVYGKLLVIDDLADRTHMADVLLDQNLGRQASHYAALVPEHCRIFAGAKFALLRKEFSARRAYSLARRHCPNMRHVLVSMGGVDRGNVTEQVLSLLNEEEMPLDAEITVVLGLHAPWIDSVRSAAKNMKVSTQVLSNVVDMAGLMAEADLAIGAAGTTAWERCALGLPTVTMVLAENQEEGAAALQRAGAVTVVPMVDGALVDFPTVWRSVTQSQVLKDMSTSCQQVTDGTGVLRIADVLCGGTHE